MSRLSRHRQSVIFGVLLTAVGLSACTFLPQSPAHAGTAEEAHQHQAQAAGAASGHQHQAQASGAAAEARLRQAPPTRYLAFQVFTGAVDPRVAIGNSGVHPLSGLPPRQAIEAFIDDVRSRIGLSGDRAHKLAFIEGPLAFDHTDAQLRQLIDDAFDLAITKDVAVGFHIDDSMFWARRQDLLSKEDNIERADWTGPVSSGRKLDWSEIPEKIPPQMCFNSRQIQSEVYRRARDVFGRAIAGEVERLRKLGKSYLFAGVIAGWETQIGLDFDTGRALGFAALTNRGFRGSHLPADADKEREKVVQEFIELWCKGLCDAGVDGSKIYSHTAFLSRKVFVASGGDGRSYSERNNFAPPAVSFGRYHQPGFSTYPQPGLFEEIYEELAARGNPAWGSCEGTNLQLGSAPGASGLNMETYLGRMFNHGATLVNIFSWGTGGDAGRNSPFRQVTESDEALGAYRKFLQGAKLAETACAGGSTFMLTLPPKMRRIQSALPAWIRRHGPAPEVESMIRELDVLMKSQHFDQAEHVADRLLEKIASP